MAFRKIRTLKADFAIQGGDPVFDVLGQSRDRTKTLYDLYAQTEHIIELPIHHVIGNHDVFGVYAKSGVALSDSDFGKRMYQDRIGKTYYSFDHKGYHSIVLDTIQITADRSWEAGIDPEQLQWLRRDFQQIGIGTPIASSLMCRW